MVRVYGCAVADQHARGLVTSLIGSGSVDALAAAVLISGGISYQSAVGKLTPGMRDAILDVLRAPPNGLLDLRSALLSDQRARR